MKRHLSNPIQLLLLILISSCSKDDIKTLPTLTTIEITGITDNSAYSGGLITNNGNDEVIERGVCWSTTILEPTIIGDKTTDGTGMGEFSSFMEGLQPGTTYYVRAYATNSSGTAYGNITSFKTNSELPTVSTAQVRLITQNTAQGGGYIDSEGSPHIIARGVCWGTEASPDLSENKTIDGTGFGNFASEISGLLSNTTYYVRAYATNNDGLTGYGPDSVFKTKANLPELTTNQASLITKTTAQVGGNIISDEGASIIARGVCWGREASPDISGNKTIDGQGTGEFVSNLTELLASTTYYFRAYATNNEGATSYGNLQEFTTLYDEIDYPESSQFGANILYSQLTTIKANIPHSFAANLPKGTNLKIKVSGGLWYYAMGSKTNWEITSYDENNKSQLFTSIVSGQKCDLDVIFEKGEITIDYYENGADSPTKTKQLIVE